MEIKTASKKDGGYKDGSFYLKGPFCHTLKTLVGDVYNAIIEAAGVEDCPMPGDLEVTDFYLDSDKLNDQILYGEYRARIHFFVEEQLKGCYLMYMNLVPKED
ncbi:uncharacterized protein LOC125226463 [Leguminivora glycinivorella]|uniref:uncharacterized protein LOC125226463 n=1 Tax=Leguminivora glycinivorella TaxID=1035111 RepID=UPI00200FAD5E|nr:uncharacterized protein LOC125226463 [Leguminivora glycinivorella]